MFEFAKIWNMKFVKVIPLVTGAFEIVSDDIVMTQ